LRHDNALWAFLKEWNSWSRDLAADRIVAVGLLTERDVNLLGPTFDRLWPVEETPGFASLLRAIDEADAELKRRKADPVPER